MTIGDASQTIKPYGKSRLEKAFKATRLLCIMAIFAFASFALVDLYIVEGSVFSLYCVRAVFIVISACIYWLCARPSLRVHAYKSGAVICISTGVGVVLLTELSGGAESLYWTMIMLVFFTASLIMPFRPHQAAAVFATIAGFYDIWIVVNDAAVNSSGWVLSNAGIWLSLFVSVLAVVYINDLRDQEDADRRQLEQLNRQLRNEIAEREKAESDLRRTQQLDAVGRLAAGVAHELNNVLLVISSSAELINRKSEEPNKYADRILESALQGARLTSDMLLFARKGHRENQPFLLNSVVESVAEMVGETQSTVLTVETELSFEKSWISGDSQLISQALLNLCLNGVDAMERPGILQIQTQVHFDRVKLIVSDTGKGMREEELQRAFEPFFTTKAPGKGTGLGLSMVYGIIKDHDGSIEIHSVSGQGTSVIIDFPLTEAPIVHSQKESRPFLSSPGNASVLLVDDDQMVRSLIKESLETSGFVVQEAENGVDALALYFKEKSRFDLVILDMVMPLMTGREAYNKIRKESQEQPILLYSGNISEPDFAQVLLHPRTRFLQKPFRQQELLEVVGQLLNE